MKPKLAWFLFWARSKQGIVIITRAGNEQVENNYYSNYSNSRKVDLVCIHNKTVVYFDDVNPHRNSITFSQRLFILSVKKALP